MKNITKIILGYCCLISITAVIAQNQSIPAIGFKSLTQVVGDYEFFNARQFPGDDNTTLLTGSFTGTMVVDGDSLQGNETGTSLLALKDSLDQWLWVQVIEGNGHNQVNNALQRDNGWIITGVFSDTILVGNNILEGTGQQRIFVAGINEDGDFQWTSSYGIKPLGSQIFVAPAANNKFYLATGFNGEFEYNDSIYFTRFVNHLFFARFSESGSVERIFQFQSKNDIELAFMREGVNGGIILGGNFSDTIFHKRRFLANEGISDFFILALDENFQIQELKSSSGLGTKKLTGVIAHQGGYLFYGSFQGEFIMEQAEVENDGPQSLFMIKFNRRGQMMWHKTIGGQAHKAFQAFAVGSQNEIYTMMNYRGELPMADTTFTTETETYKTLLMKYDPDGNFQWVTSSDNVSNFLGRMNERSRDGRIEFAGVSPGKPQVSMFEQTFEEDDKGLFTMELLDCDYAQKVSLEDTLYICGSGFVAAEEGFHSYLWNDLYPGRTVEIENSTPVYLTATDEYGCVSMDTTYVEVLPLPQVSITGNPMICPSDGSALLIASGNYNFTWNDDTEGAFLHTSEPGYYEVTATNEWGCEANAEVIVDIYPEQPPLLDETYFAGSADTLIIYPGDYASYLWSDGSELPGFTIYGSTFDEGLYNYSVDVTDYNGCAYQGQFTVSIADYTSYSTPVTTSSLIPDPLLQASSTSMEDVNNLPNEELPIGECPILIYPNPGNGVLQITQLTDSMDENSMVIDRNTELFILTPLGEFIAKAKFPKSNHITIDLSNYVQPGLHFIVLYKDESILCISKLMIIE